MNANAFFTELAAAGRRFTNASSAISYRGGYPQEIARGAPAVRSGTHITGDTFFHGPGLSNKAQYITKLHQADDYTITKMEAAAITQVIARQFGTQRILSLRGAVNFDQGNPTETTLQHLDPTPGKTAGGFEETVDNITAVGGKMTDYIVNHWGQWQNGVPPRS